MKIFSGTSNPSLSAEIAELLGSTLGKIQISQFENGEKRVVVEEEVLGEKTVVVQSFAPGVDEMIIEFCLIVDALKQKGASEVIGIVPWLGYSKQDKVFLPGEALSVQVIARIIESSGVDRLATFDLHSPEIIKFFRIPLVELSAKSLLTEYFAKKKNEKTVVVSPDKGSIVADQKFAEELGVPFVQMDKKRDLVTGQVEVVGMHGEVTGRDVIIVDDMIVTGSTTIEVTRHLKEMGATSVSVGATHHLYLPGVQAKLDSSEIDEIVVTNTVVRSTKIPNSKFQIPKLKILSVAKIIVDELAK